MGVGSSQSMWYTRIKPSSSRCLQDFGDQGSMHCSARHAARQVHCSSPALQRCKCNIALKAVALQGCKKHCVALFQNQRHCENIHTPVNPQEEG